ncbi:MAG: hypothetical protein AAF423_08480 [Pseudomonadota bacterium]
MKILIKQLLAASIVAGTTVATSTQQADSNGDIRFGGNVPVTNLCFILVRRDGTYAQSPDATQLSSRQAGGISGVADIFAIFPFQIFVDAPSFFITRPPGGDTGVSHQAFFSGTALNARGVTFPERPGSSPVQFPAFFGSTRLFVNLEATRADPFPEGDYTSTATVRCE